MVLSCSVSEILPLLQCTRKSFSIDRTINIIAMYAFWCPSKHIWINNVLYFGCQKGFKHLKWSSRSLILSPLYRPHKISYKCFIVTMCLSHTISQMLSLTSIYENLTVTRNPPLWGFFIMHRLVLAMINLHTKCETSSSSHSKGKSGAPKCKNGSQHIFSK